MALEGLEEVKKEFLKIKAMIDTARKRKGWLRRQDLNLVLLGNAGTGKRTIAALYRDFLTQYGVWPDLGDPEVKYHRTTGHSLKSPDDVKTLESEINQLSYVGIVR
ncbi:hypothetical protein F5X99DRAFT_331602 [Biscogniauxia marginata]|nr:hypothetical protein F5X99DRAFT_331602 [Biscogniauxia marginata]